jgi:hypothetical protein
VSAYTWSWGPTSRLGARQLGCSYDYLISAGLPHHDRHGRVRWDCSRFVEDAAGKPGGIWTVLKT